MFEFEKNIVLGYGAAGRVWLQNLPLLQGQLVQQFGLRDLTPCTELSYNYVVFGYKGDVPVVLKIGIDLPAVAREYQALHAFAGNGMVPVVAHDLDHGAILLLRAIPGKTLVSLFPQQDQLALEVACKLLGQIHQVPIPEHNKFPLLTEWLATIDQDWDVPSQHLTLARKLKHALLQQSHSQVLLHGDVHYANILSNGHEWVLIDPKGVIGDPLYDLTGSLLREPFKEMMDSSNVAQLLIARMQFVAQYSHAHIYIIWAWTYVQNVMSVCWALEDGQEIARRLEFLEILLKVEPPAPPAQILFS